MEAWGKNERKSLCNVLTSVLDKEPNWSKICNNGLKANEAYWNISGYMTQKKYRNIKEWTI
jgi:hypothetical protein